MLKNKLWLGIILSVILMVFSIGGFAAPYYKYTQESGANFYVSIADKADALENHNEIRQILDDLGNLLVHSKRDGSYPRDESTGGTLSIPNSALALLKAGVKGDILYCSAANVWSKLSIGADNQVLVVATDVSNWETLSSDLLSDVASIAMLDEAETIAANWINTAHPWAIDEGGTNSGAAITNDRVVVTSAGGIISSATITTTELALLDGLAGIQPLDATLTAFAGLTIGVNEIIYGTGADALAMLPVNAEATNKFLRQISSGVPSWEVLEAGDIPDISATYQPLDTALTNISGLVYVSPSFIKLTAEDSYAVRTIAEVITDLALDSDDLSDVASIAMLDENEAILGDWTVTGSIAGVDTTEFGYLDGVTSDIQTQFGLRYLKTEIDTQAKVEAIWDVSLALDSELHTILTLGTASGLTLDAQELSLTINSSTSAGAVSSGSGQASKVWKTNAEGVPGWRDDEGGVEASTFVALSDTPTFYTDKAGMFPRVKATEDGLEFYTIPGGGDVIGPATSVDQTVARFDGTDNKTIEDSLATISDLGSINIPTGQTYKINNVSLSHTDVGAIEDAANVIVSSHIDWGAGADQIDTDDVSEGSVNFYQLTSEEVDDYVYALINDGDSVHTLITITYDDVDDAYDFVVNNDLHEYDWTNVVAGDIPNLSTVYQPLDTALTNISALAYVSPSFIKLTGEDTYAVRTLAEVKTDLAYSDAEIKAILVGEVTKTGDFTAGRMAIINNASGIIEQGTNTDIDVADAVTKKHAQNSDTTFNFYNALGSDQTYSGKLDSQPVGETVAFGEILYFDWTDEEWKKAKADAFATAKGTRIALEAKDNGETCLMLVKGYIREDTLFDFGATRVFLNDDTAGRCDDTPPEESGDQIFVVGEAKSANILFFDPGKDVGEI